jgi:hypothetical protein
LLSNLSREELCIDYNWDKNVLNVPNDIPCLCGKFKCRRFLMRAATKSKQTSFADLSSALDSKRTLSFKKKSDSQVNDMGDLESEQQVKVVKPSNIKKKYF